MDSRIGALKISNEQDRLTVASILLKNGYAVSVRKEKVGNKYDYSAIYSTSTGDLIPSRQTEAKA